MIQCVCVQCGDAFSRDWIDAKRGEGKFCSRRCKGDWMRAQPRRRTPRTCRRLSDGEPLPPGEPRRYRTSSGYVILRWKVAPMTYVEAFEHRVVAGRDKPHVHHVNGVKADNRPESLLPVTTLEHGMCHCSFDVSEAEVLYLRGWSLVALSARYGKGTTNVMRALKRRGVQMRTLSESWPLRDLNTARALGLQEA